MPLVLALDTAGPHCAAALWDGALIRARHEPMTRGQAERLMPMLEEMLAEARTAWRDLAAIGVGTGPGNFTGIRIGVSAARGLALALRVPAIGVTSTDGLLLDAPGGAVAAIPAPRGQIFRAAFGAVPALFPDDGGGVRPDPEANPAIAIARLAAARLGTSQPRPAPTYARAPDAAPASAAPPPAA